VRITFDQAKRALTLEKRGLDFARAGAVFGNRHLTRIDDRLDYGETRFISIGWLAGDVVVLVDAAGRRAAYHLDEEGQWP
jgi:uncharacterized DUF497 family protein